MSTLVTPLLGTAGWAGARTEEVLAIAEASVQRWAAGQDQERLLSRAMIGMRALTTEPGFVPCVHLPLLVYAGVRGDDGLALPLAAATILLYRGIDLCDDLADGDLPAAEWAGVRPAEVSLAAATLLAALPQIVIADLDVAPERLAAMQRTVAEGLLRMGAGQATDLALAGRSEARSEAVEASVTGKSGEEAALFATLAAQLAHAPGPTIAAYAVYGRALGTAAQLISDCHDLFQAVHSRDLASGTRTLPIALHLERLDGAERRQFLDVLARARGDTAAQSAIRDKLREAGVLRRCALLVEVWCQRALGALREAAPSEPAATGLRAMVEDISFFPYGGPS